MCHRPWKPFKRDFEVNEALVVRRYSNVSLKDVNINDVNLITATNTSLEPKKKAKAPPPPVRKESLGNAVDADEVDQNGNISSLASEGADNEVDAVQEVATVVAAETAGKEVATVSYSESVQYSEQHLIKKNAFQGVVDESFNDVGLDEMKELGKYHLLTVTIAQIQ